jgi:conjugal transfer pilus assembly protein TraF
MRPVNIAAMRIYDQELRVKQRAQVAKLSKTHGLFFFFRGDCSYCHALAPQLQTFSKDTGMTIFPISMDGEGLPEYPNPVVDDGVADRMGITTVPALVLAVPSTGEKQIISFGIITDTELYERIYKLTTQNPDQQQGQQQVQF